MTECAWRDLVVAGRQAEHAALELLCRPLDAWDARQRQVIIGRRWAIRVLATADHAPRSA